MYFLSSIKLSTLSAVKKIKRIITVHISLKMPEVFFNLLLKDSLCCGSPRVATRMSNNDKYRSYMYFM
jgi:hypothetical protein